MPYALVCTGAPIWFNAPDLFDAWQAIRGVDLLGHFDYICPLTNRGRLPNILECQYEGTPQVWLMCYLVAFGLFEHIHHIHALAPEFST